ncbi:hypothetical protein V6N12_063426 [Hibiscus sabdariffa]|uniref:Uncharacterized protein n=1 Tax=Hibiscus sabdariffa TaxID=183260 RepID=A0ABR2FBS9_9ROSI
MQLNLPPLFHLNASFLTYRSSESATIASFLSSWQCLSGECWANGTATGPLLWGITVTFKKVYARCLIYEIFSGMKLGETEELRDTSIPKPLLSDYQRLLSSLPSRRLNTSKLIDNSEIFQNKLVDTHIVQYGEPLSAQVVDDQVYPHIATGFSGTSAFLRELTLKSLLLLAPKLSQRNLSGSLLKYLSKLKSLQLEQILPYCWETLQATSICWRCYFSQIVFR